MKGRQLMNPSNARKRNEIENSEKSSVYTISDSDEDDTECKNQPQATEAHGGQDGDGDGDASGASDDNDDDRREKLRQMFIKLDGIANEVIASPGRTLHKEISTKMNHLSIEIEQLEEEISTKTLECNRLIHLKTIKEEIYRRLGQRKRTLILSGKYFNANFTLHELAELEKYFSMKSTVPME